MLTVLSCAICPSPLTLHRPLHRPRVAVSSPRRHSHLYLPPYPLSSLAAASAAAASALRSAGRQHFLHVAVLRSLFSAAAPFQSEHLLLQPGQRAANSPHLFSALAMQTSRIPVVTWRLLLVALRLRPQQRLDAPLPLLLRRRAVPVALTWRWH